METTLLLVVGLVFAVGELAMGTIIGWWLRGKRDTTSVAAQNQAADEQTNKARKALENLNRLAATVATDVGKHNTQLQAINTELSEVSPTTGASLDSVVLASVAKLMEANERLQTELKSAETKLHEQAHELEAREIDALTDALTGLNNRRSFDNEMERRIIEWNRRQTPVTLLMIDVDHFKKFNDTHGHQAGDEVLKSVADKLRNSMRDMDLVARYGGEEFGVVMPVTTIEQSKVAVERARAAVENAVCKFEGKELKVTISCGVSQSAPGDVPAALLKRADEALYAAKKAGRNRGYMHDGKETFPLTPGATPVTPSTMSKSLEEVAAKKSLPAKSTTANATPITVPSAKPQAPGKPGEAESTTTESSKQSTGETDPHTGVASRAVYGLDMRRRVAEAKRYASALSTMIVTVDNFADFRSTQGEAIGNLVLRTVAQFLSAAIREMDTVARYDESSFAILLPGTQLMSAAAIAERLRQSISLHALKSANGELKLTVSIGLAEVESNDEADTLAQRAANAAQAATLTGRNRTCLSRNGHCVSLDSVPATSA